MELRPLVTLDPWSLCGYRYYDPNTTKWISKDPLGEAGGWNLTCFCGNDPVNGYDPLGLDPYSVINETSSVSMSFATLFQPPPREFFITADDRSTIGYEMERDIRGIPVYRLKSTGYSATSLPELRRTAASLGKNVVTPLPPENAELGVLRKHYVETGQFDEVVKVDNQIRDEFEWKMLDVFFALETAGELATLRKTLESESRIVYRALNSKDAARIKAGLGLEAKNPSGSWDVGQHVALGSRKSAWVKDPWIATTPDLNIARGFEGGNGIVAIDLNKVPSIQLKAWELYPRVNGEAGLPYHWSIWQQEISVFQNIPLEAIKGFVK